LSLFSLPPPIPTLIFSGISCLNYHYLYFILDCGPSHTTWIFSSLASSDPIPPRVQVLCLDRLRSGPTISTNTIRHPPPHSTFYRAQNASRIHFRLR
jgi:hypothetical protein